MKGYSRVPAYFFLVIGWATSFALPCPPGFSHEGQKKTAQEIPKKSEIAGNPEKADQPEKVAHPAQIELLETKVQFETNGDSRKEVHALVKIHSEPGVRQFAQLNFDFNRSFESVEIPMVHIIHASGGTADILPSAVTDRPNPAVVNAPAYQDVRVKSVRILGLQPGDTLEYRVIRTVLHHPLAPNFWLDHSFDRSGVISHEIYELDLPASHSVQLYINPTIPASSINKSGNAESARVLYRWSRTGPDHSDRTISSNEADVILTSYRSWGALSDQLAKILEPSSEATHGIREKALQLAASSRTDEARLEALYDFVSAKIGTVDLPIGAAGFRTRSPAEVLTSGYATAEDKFALLSGLAWAFGIESRIALFGSATKISGQLPTPSSFVNCAVLSNIPRPPHYEGHGLYSMCDHCGKDYWLAPSLEVAPFAVLPSNIRGKEALIPNYLFALAPFAKAPKELPFPSTQMVHVDATLNADGGLAAKVHYLLRGDNELVLRVAFHQSAREKWKELAQLLSITDGFRGQVTSVNASDPYATKDPFTVEYELNQPKFVDWSKKPVRIPALLPQFGLPDPPSKPASGSATAPIELGTPLEVETKMTLHLPPGTSASAPAGTSVERDYATYSSQYSVNGSTLTATRRIKFVLREVPAARAADYNAFLRAVQHDEGQDFTLERPDNLAPKTSLPKTNSTAPNGTTPPKTASPKP